VNSPLRRNLLTCKEPDYPSRGKCGNWSWVLPLLLHAWCWLLSGRALSTWTIRVIWCHRSNVWKLKVASLLKDELEIAACVNLPFTPFPSQFPCLCHLHFQKGLSLIFFACRLMTTEDSYKSFPSAPLGSANTDSFYVIHLFRSTDCRLQGSMKEDLEVPAYRGRCKFSP